MNEVQRASCYLLPRFPAHRIWRWGDGGEVVEWRAGGTIAFRDQIRSALAVFDERMLPPIELIVIVLGATRDTWPDDRWRLEKDDRYRGDMPAAEWKEILESLEQIHRLPEQMRHSAGTVAAVVDILFEDHPFETMEAGPVLQLLAQPEWMDELAGTTTSSVPESMRTMQLNWLARRARQLTIERLLTRMSTGLDELPVPGDELSADDDSSERSVSRLLEELREDSDYAGLVRMVRQVSAVLTLPRRLSESDELPQGGVSDLTNRGTPDQLLLSELAHDEVTLTARIALNEALYLRRETPPSDPIQERTLLIDVGIRTWGLPRLFAAAVALSLARVDRGMSVSVFHTAPDGLASVDFATRAGLTEHLKTLDHQLHPGAQLEAWQKATAGENIQRVLITEDSVSSDAEFRRLFDQLELAPCFVVSVSRSGRVRLFVRTLAGEKLQREIRLDADQVSVADRTEIDSLIDPSRDPHLPALMRLKRMPLRLPCELSDAGSVVPFPAEDGESADTLQITRDQRLLLWDVPQAGGRQLTDRLPRGNVRWFGSLSDDGSVSILIDGPQSAGLFHVQVQADRQTVVIRALGTPTSPNGSRQISAVAARMGVILVIFRRSAIAVDAVTGEVLGSLELPKGCRWVRDRYFQQQARWYVLSYSADRLSLELLAEPAVPTRSVHALGIVGPDERPLVIYSNGQAYDTVTREKRLVTTDGAWIFGHIGQVSADGYRFLAVVSRAPDGTERASGQADSGGHAAIVDVQPGDTGDGPMFCVTPLTRVGDHRMDLAGGRTKLKVIPGSRSLFKKPARLCYGRRLMIMTAKGRRLCLAPRATAPRGIILRDATADDEPWQDSENFSEIPSPSEIGFRLRQVTWTDGSRAVLDSRGLLHLQSSDPDIPELSLILNEANVSGWCSDHGTWGLNYFIDTTAPGHETMDPERVMEIIEQFLQRLP